MCWMGICSIWKSPAPPEKDIVTRSSDAFHKTSTETRSWNESHDNNHLCWMHFELLFACCAIAEMDIQSMYPKSRIFPYAFMLCQILPLPDSELFDKTFLLDELPLFRAFYACTRCWVNQNDIFNVNLVVVLYLIAFFRSHTHTTDCTDE